MYTVTIPFSESLAFHGPVTFTDLAAAEAWVRQAVPFAPVGGGYDKTDVVIAAEGFQYTLRLDIDGDTPGSAIVDHLRASLANYTARAAEVEAGVPNPYGIDWAAYRDGVSRALALIESPARA